MDINDVWYDAILLENVRNVIIRINDVVQVLLIANISRDKDAQEKQTKEDQSPGRKTAVISRKISLQEKSQTNASGSLIIRDLPASNQQQCRRWQRRHTSSEQQ